MCQLEQANNSLHMFIFIFTKGWETGKKPQIMNFFLRIRKKKVRIKTLTLARWLV